MKIYSGVVYSPMLVVDFGSNIKITDIEIFAETSNQKRWSFRAISDVLEITKEGSPQKCIED